MPELRKAIEQRQKNKVRKRQMKKVPKKINIGLSDKHKDDNNDIDESQDY